MDDGSRSHFWSWLFKDKNEETAEDEIVSILNEGQDQGTIRESEAEMIANIFELDDIEASQIMTHRKNISAVDIHRTLASALEWICEENFSRFPVYDENIDNIVGILHIKDAVRAYLDKSNRDKELSELPDIMQKPLFIPETSKIDTVFHNMQAEKTHMAIVVDEYGQTAGIIAMEDILEEIKAGFGNEGLSKAIFIPDRKEAIRAAIMFASEGAIVLLAGKGHETYQIIGTEKRHFDEREIVSEVFKQMEIIEK